VDKKFVDLRKIRDDARTRLDTAGRYLNLAENKLQEAINGCEHEPIIGTLPDRMVETVRSVFGKKFLKDFNQGPVCKHCGYAGENGYNEY
jgi:hypothetical protein